MTLFKREMRAGLGAMLIWSGVIAGMAMLCMIIYPSFENQMSSFTALFSSMGAFTAAFGMDRLDFATAIGFYGVEAGTTLTVGGAMYAALTGVTMLSKEESGHTAEFLLTHPVRRGRVVLEKLAALLGLVAALNALCFLLALASFWMIGESVPLGRMGLYHLAVLALHVELACVSLGLSALSRRSRAGLGLGLAVLLYFVGLVANITDAAAALRYVTPFAYAEAATILAEGRVEGALLAIGGAVSVCAVLVALWVYARRDIAA